MKNEEIIERVKQIEETKDDNEVAHSMEDQLYVDFIRYVSQSGNEQLAIKAKLVLKAQDIEYGRWYA
jgi:uncharacterized protein (DUF1697 family)